MNLDPGIDARRTALARVGLAIGGLVLHTDTSDPVPVQRGDTVLDGQGSKVTILSAMREPGTAAPWVAVEREGRSEYVHPAHIGLKWVLMGATYAG